MDPESRSHSQGYTVLDWAVWARRNGSPGAEAVVEYLRAEWPQIGESGSRETEAQARKRGLATPISNGPGLTMMLAMGWRPGDTLGVAPQAGALRTPLIIPEPRHTSDKRGLGYDG